MLAGSSNYRWSGENQKIILSTPATVKQKTVMRAVRNILIEITMDERDIAEWE